MSTFGVPRGCNNDCGATIYFDAHSSVGHPTADKWLPLEFKEGRKTDTIHICPNKKQNGILPAVVTAAATTNNTSLSFAESLDQVLQDYIRLKRLELAA